MLVVPVDLVGFAATKPGAVPHSLVLTFKRQTLLVIDRVGNV